MADLLGFTSIFLVSLITLLVALKWPEISKILLVALTIRVFFLLIGHYIIPLQGRYSDAVLFEIKAWEFGEKGFFYILNNLSIDPFVFFSSFHAILYSLFGRSILMGQSISLLFGIGVIFLGWKLANKIWDKRTANKVGWIIALFPSLILYSVLFMREIYICFFLLLALCGVVDWVKTKSFKSIILVLIGFIGATLLHSPMLVGALAFMTIVGTISLKQSIKSLINFRINLKNLMFLTFFIIGSGIFLSNKIDLPYIGNFKDSTNATFLLEKTNFAHRGDASWPEWTKAKTPIELLYKAPVRSIYFIFSPFPWDLKRTEHLIAVFDSILYMYLFFLILRNIKIIWRDPVLRAILIILLTYIIAFGFGVGNFGTGLRHRSKFSVMLILLAGPLIKRLRFKKKSITIP